MLGLKPSFIRFLKTLTSSQIPNTIRSSQIDRFIFWKRFRVLSCCAGREEEDEGASLSVERENKLGAWGSSKKLGNVPGKADLGSNLNGPKGWTWFFGKN